MKAGRGTPPSKPSSRKDLPWRPRHRNFEYRLEVSRESGPGDRAANVTDCRSVIWGFDSLPGHRP